ncbi:MAG: restriction endonuclease [Planctomycetes bacterium RIFCSPHIGHO2_12_39_6]|nr:MAG: restriction endonuclease [Planctomycetes bacterium RIFCSPHIGHO2_12_39_6]OHB98146.1 MAG: restriction endonuclease [Planctomycetes bacterium RIFCSPLOWO2_12_38_17]
MAIPDYQTIILPLLKFYSDNQEHSFRDAVEEMAKEFKLTDQERKELLPSGQQEIFDNRVGWARTYMKKACLIDPTRRGHNKITQRGLDVIKQKPQKINVDFLQQFSEFKSFLDLRHNKQDEEQEPEINNKTPEESLENAYQKIRNDLTTELLKSLKSCSPNFFERLVIDVIIKIGYGGTRQDAGKAIGKSGDGGIDGIIKEDKLGLDTIYIQAKRWENTVGRPEIQKFVGALTGQRAKKGLFITTSDFSKDSLDYVSRIDTKIVLIDGETLAQLMIDHNVGVSTIASYELKKIDSDYFSEE